MSRFICKLRLTVLTAFIYSPFALCVPIFIRPYSICNIYSDAHLSISLALLIMPLFHYLFIGLVCLLHFSGHLTLSLTSDFNVHFPPPPAERAIKCSALSLIITLERLLEFVEHEESGFHRQCFFGSFLPD